MSVFDTFYQINPFAGMTMNKRTWFAPDLLETYRKKSVWQQFTPAKVEINGTDTMTFSMFGDFEPNVNAIGWYDLYVPAMFADSRQISITTARYGGKVQLYRQDDFLNYWRQGEMGAMSAIIRSRLGPAIVKHLDALTRNAYLQNYFKAYAMDSANDGFNHIVTGDTFDLDWLDSIQVRMSTLDLPGFDGQPGTIACITSPGALHAIRKHENWEEFNKYTPEGRTTLLNGEVGAINGVHFIPSNDAILWNAGTMTQQSVITAPISAGSGAAATAYGWSIGQSSATHYLQLDSVTNLAPNDVITIHKVRTSDYGVTNGVDPYDGMTFRRIIYSVDSQNKRISLTEPLLWDFTQDLGSGAFGYVTKGIHIHTSTFIAGPGAVVLGVTQPIRLTEPVPADDFNSVYRLSYEGFFKYQPFRSEWAFTVFHAGVHSIDGSLQTGA